jgi:hypothetical protein
MMRRFSLSQALSQALPHTLGAALALLALGAAAPPAHAWTSAVALSTGGEGWEASADVDAAGRASAVWLERTTRGLTVDRVWTADGMPDGSWTPGSRLSRKSPSLGTTYVFPKVHVGDDGAAIAVWFDTDGTWAADRPAGGAWRKPYLLAQNIFAGSFIANRRGDAAFVYSTDTPRGSSSALYALLRPAGSRWGAVQTVATGPHVPLGSAVLSEAGELLIAWGTYNAVCSRHCAASNHMLNASRLTAGRWAHTTGLAGPAASAFGAIATLSSTGAGGLLYSGSATEIRAITQASARSAWGAPAVAVASSTTLLLMGAFADASGSATLAYLDLNLANDRPLRVVNGDLALNEWSAPVPVSGADMMPNQVQLAGNDGGAAVLAWTAGDSSVSNGQVVRVAVRPGRDTAWDVPQTVSPKHLSFAAPEAAAIGSNGHAVVVFSAYDAGFAVHTEYASRHRAAR